MNWIALRMLTGDRAKYVGIIMGLTFASLLITQQAAIFSGFMTRTYAQISDTPMPDIWVMDPEVEFAEDIKRMLDRELWRVRGVEGVAWAVPQYKGFINARLPGGRLQPCTLIGIDDATLIGGPPQMAEGRLEDLRTRDAIVIDSHEASAKMGKRPLDRAGRIIPDAPLGELKIGDTLELNDHRAVVVGTCRITPPFYWQPIIYTTYKRAVSFGSGERKVLSYILVKAKPGENPKAVATRIHDQTGLAAYTSAEFAKMTSDYVAQRTGIAVNFGIAILLGFIVGAAVAGQTFYNFTLDNLRHFAALKAMGATTGVLLRMILLQAATVGFIGYGLGVGAAALFGWAARNTELAFHLSWELMLASGAVVMFIAMLAAMISLRKVIRLEPAIVFKG